ncbi:hypothetical protein B0H14DRAFT_2606980 [Mycena olivaceomarginata]|nr:hypothetical protein B0H14DRAFT_2606980 [Mycena olivaceomarginata]
MAWGGPPSMVVVYLLWWWSHPPHTSHNGRKRLNTGTDASYYPVGLGNNTCVGFRARVLFLFGEQTGSATSLKFFTFIHVTSEVLLRLGTFYEYMGLSINNIQ